MKTLIIIDMLNGFCRGGYPLSLKTSTSKIEKYIMKQLDELLANNGKVIFLCDCHKLSDPEINHPYPLHCMEGTIEAEIIDSLQSYVRKSTVLKKHTLSIFFNTELENILQEIQPTEIEVSGVCADICVLFAVYELRIRGYNVFVSNYGVEALDPSKQAQCLDYYKNKLGARVG